MNRSRRSAASVAANPVLVGAVTLLVTIVAVFLSYNANKGLPFVPTRQLNLDVNNGAQLVPGNEVREGGYRVGVLDHVTPVTLPDGTSGARLKLKLDMKNPPLPVDSRFTIRPKSALGLKIVDVTRGTSKKTFPDGATVGVKQTRVPVQLEDVFSMFDAKTRQNNRRVLVNLGGALSDRGTDLNVTIQHLPSLLQHLTPVAENLQSPKTDLRGFIHGTGRFVSALAPVSTTNVKLLNDLGTTFAAINSVPGDYQATIAKSPETLAVSTEALRATRPFLAHLAAFSTDLRLAAVELTRALPDINAALAAGIGPLRRSVRLDAQLQATMRALKAISEDPRTYIGLRALTDTVNTLNPMIRFLGPYVTVCNFWNYFWTFVAEHLSQEDPQGYAQRVLLNSASIQDNGLGQTGAVVPANGEKNLGVPPGKPQFLHAQPYGAAVTSGGAADCEQGQRGYMSGRLVTPPMRSDRRFNIVTAPHTPGAQGPTFRGRRHVPKGETFQRAPNINALTENGTPIRVR